MIFQRWLDLIYPGELFTAQPEYRPRWQAVQRRLFVRDLALCLGVGLVVYGLSQLF